MHASIPDPAGAVEAPEHRRLRFRGRYNPVMSKSPRSVNPLRTPTEMGKKSNADAVLCERCDAEMFRMHAVWRCPSCGFKTDCCGW